MRELIINQIKTPDGTILMSLHEHDFKMYTDKVSGEVYLNDGGNSYIRRSINKVPFTDISIYSDSPFEVLREHLTWGTYGKNGDEPLQRKPIKDPSSEHIQAILTNCGYISQVMKESLNKELEYRDSAEVKEEHWSENE